MNVVVTIHDEALRATLGGFYGRLMDRGAHARDRFSVRLQARVKDKLSDQVLHVRTGTLRRSINRSVQRTPTSIDAVVGTNVEYAAVHEYGFHGTVSVRAHLRAIRASGKFKPKKGSAPGGAVQVKAHTRNVNLPERSFLRSALRELEGSARIEIAAAAKSALEGS